MNAVQYIVPIVGLVASNFLALSPVNDFLRANKTRILGEINVFPIAMVVPNCLAWMLYATSISSMWVWWSNFPGFIAGLWYLSVTLKCLDLRYNQLLMIQIVVGFGVICDSLCLMSYISMPGDEFMPIKKEILGTLCIAMLMIFYVAPLSTIVSVIKSQDSSPIMLSLALCTVLNGSVWLSYGLSIGDPFVYGPNVLGFMNGTVQIVCCLIFPRRVTMGKSLLSTSESAFNRNISFGSVDTEINFSNRNEFGQGLEVDTPTSSPNNSRADPFSEVQVLLPREPGSHSYSSRLRNLSSSSDMA